MASKKSDHKKQKKVNEDPGVTYNDVSSSVSCAYEVEAQPIEVLEDICRQKLRNRQTCCGVRPPIVKVPGRVEIISSETSEIVVDWDSSIYKIPKQCHIPVGPHFQADIPEWTGFKKFDNGCSNIDNAGDLRWLGTRVWPMEGKNTDASFKDIGKGRTEHCSCRSTGSIDCVSQHVLEESRKLQSELGFAFYSWRIDEMGEGITKSWTTKEHKSFNSLVKKSMNSKRVNFWKQGPKCFPGKSGKDLQQCFLNVFIPRRVGLQTRLSWRSTDTDDSDNGEDVDDSKIRAKCKHENTSVKRSKYLRGDR